MFALHGAKTEKKLKMCRRVVVDAVSRTALNGALHKESNLEEETAANTTDVLVFSCQSCQKRGSVLYLLALEPFASNMAVCKSFL